AALVYLILLILKLLGYSDWCGRYVRLYVLQQRCTLARQCTVTACGQCFLGLPIATRSATTTWVFRRARARPGRDVGHARSRDASQARWAPMLMPIRFELRRTIAGPEPLARMRRPVRCDTPARVHHSLKRRT